MRRRNSRSMPKCLNSSICAFCTMRFRAFVLVHGNALCVPVDRFGLFAEGRDHTCESTRFLRQFVGWLVILIESHRWLPQEKMHSGS